MKDLMSRVYASRHLIPALTFLAVMSLVLSTYAVVQYTRQQADQETDRIVADVESCSRGNVLRGQTVAVGEATGDLIEGIVAEVPPSAFESGRLDVLFADFYSRVHEIVPVDCEALTPGAGE